MLPHATSIRQRDSQPNASGKPGAVHIAISAISGGRRKRQRDVNHAENAVWRVQSFHNYADYALGKGFQSALYELEDAGADQSVALMCSEAVWWRCHRRIIADCLFGARASGCSHGGTWTNTASEP
jgi:uncharacterized protein (DUF488 family)|tara:strand:+ start:6459 stop:6836 length:378 start_codon:yes stop_codon:yes gene_type:complete